MGQRLEMFLESPGTQRDFYFGDVLIMVKRLDFVAREAARQKPEPVGTGPQPSTHHPSKQPEDD